MTSKEILNLCETYYCDMYELDEAGRMHSASDQQVGFARIKAGESGGEGHGKVRSDDEISQEKGGKEFLERIKKTKKNPKYQKEQVDIYDLILSHLLDEGFADTEEAATVIMANMSEEWREEILDEAVEIMSVTSPDGKKRKGSRIYSGKSSQMVSDGRKLVALQRRQRSNPKAMSTRSARAQADQEREYNTKKSINNLNVDPNDEVRYGHDAVDPEGYREVPTDHAARRRRASGR
jgi:hypothetical protein